MNTIFSYFFQMRWQDYVDIAIVAVLTYLLLVRIRGTKAFQIVIGIVVLFGLNFLTRWTGLYVTSWVFQYLWAVILLGLIILFQPEIRRMLEEVISPFDHRCLNDTGEFSDLSPTSENIARFIYTALAERLARLDGVHLAWVSVSESPDTKVVYREEE